MDWGLPKVAPKAPTKGKAKAEKSAPAKSAKPTVPAKAKAKGAQKKAPAKKAEPQTAERTYGLNSDKAAELKKAKAYNAYREGSSYWTVVETLHSLGVGKFHSSAALIAQYQKETDKAALQAFKSKEPRNENGADWKAKIIQNAYVTTRKDYGKRMRDIGWEVRSGRDEKGQTFGLFRMGK